MLLLTRKQGQSFYIAPASGIDCNMTLDEAFALGPIEIRLCGYTGDNVNLAVNASRLLQVVPSECLKTLNPTKSA